MSKFIKLLLSIFAGWLGLASAAVIPMSTIFMTPGNGTDAQYTVLNILMCFGFVLGLCLFVFHIRSQISLWKYNGEGAFKLVLLKLFMPPIVAVLYLVLSLFLTWGLYE